MFANIKVFYLFIAVPLIVLIFVVDILQQRKRAKMLAGSNASEILPFYSESQKWIRIIFYTLGLVLSIVALARPRWGFETIESNVKGRDVMIVLDTSYSMATGDVAPTRLDSAKRSIVEMLRMNTSDRVGLMVFSGSCELLAPVTHDYAAVEFFLESVYPGMLAKAGTNIGDAVMTAIDAFDDNEPRNKMILLMTDGEDLDGPYYRMLKKAKESGIKIFTVGIGSGNGEPIPLRNSKGEIESYVKDENGKHVISRLNESRLIEIAETSGGSYMKSTNSKGELRRFIESINSIESKEQSDLKYEQMKEHYDIFLIPALLCFAIGFILDQGRLIRKNDNRFGWLGNAKRLWFFVALLLSFGMFAPLSTFSQEADQSSDVPVKKLAENMNGGFWGNKAFNKGNYDKALDDYSRAVNKLKGNDLAKLYYNMANTYFMKEDYAKAAEYYENASWFAKDSSLRAKISYNNGLNAFKQKKFDEAMVNFKQSLAEDDSNDDARYNYQICRKLLEMAKQQQQNQQNQQNQDQQQQQQSEEQQAQQAEQNENEEKQDEQQEQQAEQRKPTREEMQQMLDALDNKEKDEQKNKAKENQKNQKGKYW